MQRTAEDIANGSAKGARKVKAEETTGLPLLEIRIDKAEIARRGLNLATIEDLIETAIGGRVAGLVFEGNPALPDRGPPERCLRSDISALENLPVPLPHANSDAPAASILLRTLAWFEQTDGANQISRENGKRRVVATAEVRGRDCCRGAGQDRRAGEARPRQLSDLGCQFYGLDRRQRHAGLRGMPFSIPAAVGFIALSGVALNGLVMLSQIRMLIGDGLDTHGAIKEG